MFEKGHRVSNKRKSLPVELPKTLNADSPNLLVMIASAKRSPYSRGRDLWLRMAEKGERLTPVQMILAKCCECSGFFFDGRMDCQVETYSLYPKMPYGKYRKIRNQSKTEPAVTPTEETL